MKPKKIPQKSNFVGREYERSVLKKIEHATQASIVVVYGRRRVGKTELIEQSYRNRNIIKIEGIEGKSEKAQITHVLLQLSEYTQDPLIAKIQCSSWVEVFQIIAGYIEKGAWTLYFEEVQWLANFQDNFISELKVIWDNHLRRNKELILILCGSSPSFMLTHVVKSRSLYNRSQYEIPLKPFDLRETKEFLEKRSNREVLEAYLVVGGIPEYLNWINKESSVFLSLCRNSFTAGSFFSREYEKIFISNLANNKNYKKIIELLSKRRFATRDDLLKHLKIQSGGTLTTLLQDLQMCGFIKRYTPFYLNSDSLVARYCIQDAYLQFYFKFIYPIKYAVEQGDYHNNPMAAIKTDNYYKWLGFAFERFCRDNHPLFAKLLGFHAVQYRSGAFFSKKTNADDPGYQIDLIFDRADGVYTICEIKYTQAKVNSKVITDFERKLALFPNIKNKTIQKVLIASNRAEKGLMERGYFDQIITLDTIFDHVQAATKRMRQVNKVQGISTADLAEWIAEGRL